MKKIFRFAPLVALATPFLASAQSTVPGGINIGVITPYSNGIINFINGILVPVLMAVAFIYFLYGVYKYFILGAADEKSRTDGRQFVLWGIIGFVAILSVWGLVSIVGGAFGLSPGGNSPPTPKIGPSTGQNTSNTNVPLGGENSYIIP